MSWNLRLVEPVGVDEVVGRVTSQDPAPFIHVGQTGNPPRLPFLTASRRFVITSVWFVMESKLSASFTVLHLGKEKNWRLEWSGTYYRKEKYNFKRRATKLLNTKGLQTCYLSLPYFYNGWKCFGTEMW